jgi:PiT family inorganic phosphate transporter
VSFSHGSNDGQKGVGLVMLILIGIVPAYFALNNEISPATLTPSVNAIENVLSSLDGSTLSEPDRKKLQNTVLLCDSIKTHITGATGVAAIEKENRFVVRKNIMVIDRNIKSLLGKDELRISDADRATLESEIKSIKKITDYSPKWVILMIALSLGLGTMIGWKRIVKTIGEKIGKEHLTYAQGASAELVAASTIGVSTYFGLPVSTTHVLSSGIAGSMVASKGIKNLQADTVRNILLAWFLTLPVVMILSGTLFLLFRNIF